MPATPITICVIDDDPLVAKTIAGMLQPAGYEVVTHSSGDSFLQSTGQSDRFGCILLDVRMPGIDGLQVLQKLAEQHNSVPVIMISGEGDISTAVTAMRDGASDFIEKPFTPDELEKVVARAVATRTAETARSPELAVLSTREMEVLELLVAGDANKVIAYKLGISQRTVEVHRARIMERLEVRTFAELVRKAIAAGL